MSPVVCGNGGPCIVSLAGTLTGSSGGYHRTHLAVQLPNVGEEALKTWPVCISQTRGAHGAEPITTRSKSRFYKLPRLGDPSVNCRTESAISRSAGRNCQNKLRQLRIREFNEAKRNGISDTPWNSPRELPAIILIHGHMLFAPRCYVCCLVLTHSVLDAVRKMPGCGVTWCTDPCPASRIWEQREDGAKLTKRNWGSAEYKDHKQFNTELPADRFGANSTTTSCCVVQKSGEELRCKPGWRCFGLRPEGNGYYPADNHATGSASFLLDGFESVWLKGDTIISHIALLV